MVFVTKKKRAGHRLETTSYRNRHSNLRMLKPPMPTSPGREQADILLASYFELAVLVGTRKLSKLLCLYFQLMLQNYDKRMILPNYFPFFCVQRVSSSAIILVVHCELFVILFAISEFMFNFAT